MGSLKYFEISVLRHIRFAELRKTINRTITFNKSICNLTPEVCDLLKYCGRELSLLSHNILLLLVRFPLKQGPNFHLEISDYSRQEANGPRVAHLSDIATADMQMLCNIFPILAMQLMKRSSFKQLLILKKNIIYGMTVNGAWSFEQTLNHISTVGSWQHSGREM